MWAFKWALKKREKREQQPAGTWGAGTKAKELCKTITEQTHSQSDTHLGQTCFFPNVSRGKENYYTMIFQTHTQISVAAANLDCGVPREPKWSQSKEECSKVGQSLSEAKYLEAVL